MRIGRWMMMVVAVSAMGCGSTAKNGADGSAQVLSGEKREAVETSLREFMSKVAQDISSEGPLAWQKEFQDSPSFSWRRRGSWRSGTGKRRCKGFRGCRKLLNMLSCALAMCASMC